MSVAIYWVTHNILDFSVLVLFQVMSDTVSKALRFTFGDTAKQTACFVEKIDKFFDCFNVLTFSQGKFSKKIFQVPYRRADDFHMKVCVNHLRSHCIVYYC